jgi:ABC-2 type transport system permease protein
MSTLRKHLRIAHQYARMGVRRRSQFRVEFVSQVIMDCIWYAAKIGVFEVLYQYTSSLAGWRATDIRVFLGFVFIADAFMMMWLGHRWVFGRELKDGKLDPFRVRPANTVFLYFFQQFSLEAVLNMAVGGIYLVFALHRAGVLSDPWSVPRVLWAIVVAWWSMTAMTVAFSIIELWLLNSDLSMFLTHAFDLASTNPLDVFTRHVRSFLLWGVPVGLINYVPAAIALGRMSAPLALLYTAWILVFGLLACRAWIASFRRYESAMS